MADTIVEKLKALIGDKSVITDRSLRAAAGRDGHGNQNEPIAIAYPVTPQQVADCVKIINTEGQPFHVVSTGKNWGYGVSSPYQEKSILINLSRMNRVIEVSEAHYTARIEAGVTQGQLSQYLREHQINAHLDCTGAGPNASILGNICERGFGHTPLADKFVHSCNYKVVLPNGELLQTGPQGRLAGLFKYGAGPSLDGLFIQSNFGIIVEATISLQPAPEFLGIAIIEFANDQNFFDALPKLRELKHQGTLKSAIHIGNDLRVLSSRQTRPGASPISDDMRTKLKKQYSLSAWSGIGVYYGPRAGFSVFKHQIKKSLTSPVRVRFLGHSTLSFLTKVQPIFQKYFPKWGPTLQLNSLLPVIDLMEGKPSEEHLKGVYWAIPDVNIADIKHPNPEDKRIGLYWVSPQVPAQSNDLAECVSVYKNILQKYGLDDLVTFTFVSANCLQAIISLNYDAQNAQESTRAKNCYKELTRKFIELGFHPYRLPVSHMEMAKTFIEPSQLNYLEQLKKSSSKNEQSNGRYGLS